MVLFYSHSSFSTPKQDPYNTLTIQWENDAASTLKGTSDQYYTNGLRIGWTSPTDTLPQRSEERRVGKEC